MASSETLLSVPPRHPARYHDDLLPEIAELLDGARHVVDPFGGTGKLAAIKRHGFDGLVYINEIEPEWAAQAMGNGADHVTIGDACQLPYGDGVFDAACTSPVYGNKMSEHANWTDGSKRITYKAYLGRALHPHNAGRFYFGTHDYADIHWRAYLEMARVLRPGGRAVINTKNFIRRGEVVPVSEWHVSVLQALGFRLIGHRQIPTPGARFGANHGARVDHEDLFAFIKP